ncbi:MAG: VWA domain-containing protein [Lachnospiraceae bacterium]|nr:VWA domain-containing protein [Lachnospiraceae bacterium]
MKKLLALLLVLAMISAAVGCSGEESETDDTGYSVSKYEMKTESTSEGSSPASGTVGKSTPAESSPASGILPEPEKNGGSFVGDGSATDSSDISSSTTDTAAPGEITESGSTTALSEAIEYKKDAVTADIVIEGKTGEYSYDESAKFAPESGSYKEGEIVITDPYEPIWIDDPYIGNQITSGLLTAGEWNDNKNFGFIRELLENGQSYNYSEFFRKWGLSPFTRTVVKVTAAGEPAVGAHVTVNCASNGAVYHGVTDHEGMCYVYYSLLDENSSPTEVVVSYGSDVKTVGITPIQLTGEENVSVDFDDRIQSSKKLDLMFTVDTTGSMGDEIRYLQKELENVIKRVQEDCGNIPVRLSVNFYRDQGDAYVVRPYDFTTDINSALADLAREYADGGGDYEEAVELALDNSINDHTWDAESIKLMFMVLDAPPHNTAAIRSSLHESIKKASEQGIRIIPVASSGVDKDTEFLLRAFAMTTGGTYTFLTDDSGIGESHIEPTVGDYEVEHLNDMLVRIIKEYIGGMN